MNKFKNMKSKKKAQLSHDRREIKETGGGKAKLTSNNNEVDAYGFRPMQIEGLGNKFDSDGVVLLDPEDVEVVAGELVGPDAVVIEPTVEMPSGAAILTTPNTANKIVSRFMKSNNRKTPVEMDPELVELRKRKAELEVKLLEKQLENAEMEKEKTKTEIDKNKLKISKLRIDLGLSDGIFDD